MIVADGELKPKQKRFCDEYLIDLNATKAAIRAGYSPKTADRASDWVNADGQEKPSSKFKPAMKAYIDARMAEKDKQLIASQDEVLKYLTSVLRGESQAEVVVVENIGDFMSEARLIQKAPDEKEKLKAAELLGKRYGIYTEKVNMNVKPVVIMGVGDLEE